MNSTDFFNAFTQILSALPLTLFLVVMSLAIGLVLAVVLAFMRLSTNKFLSNSAKAYVYYFRGTPLLLQMYLLYFGLGFWLAGNSIDKNSFMWSIINAPYWYAILALTFNTAGYTAEIIRGSIKMVPRGLIDASHSLGLPKNYTRRFIVLPLAFRFSIPAYSNEIILMIKGSSLASAITVMEMTGIMLKIRAETYAIYELIAIVGVLYLSLNYLSSIGTQALEKKFKIPNH